MNLEPRVSDGITPTSPISDAAVSGWQVSDILVPLLQQGFTDREEFVIAKAIRTVTILIELGHIKKPTVTDIIQETACCLCHPNLWIRHEICGMIATTARNLSAIDVQCKIMPAIQKFLKTPIIQVEKPDILLDCILPLIPRQIYDSVIRFTDVHKFIHALEERAKVRSATRSDAIPQYGDMGQTLGSLFRRLTSDGLTEQVEKQLLARKNFLAKLKYKSQQDADEPSISSNGRFSLRRKFVVCHKIPLGDRHTNTKMNLEPRFSDGITPTSPISDAAVSPGGGLSGSPASGVIVLGTQPTTVSVATSLGEYTMPERNYWQRGLGGGGISSSGNVAMLCA